MGQKRASAVPTFAFVNGAAMGGGLELALHCHYRTLSGGAAALALPEVSLGLVPGWGGTQLLPNLIGIPAATQVIIQNPLMQNRMLRPEQAAELGISDVLLEPADFLERSIEWAAGVVRGEITVQRPEVDRDMWDGVLFFARKLLDEKLHGAVPSAYKALDLLALAKDAEQRAAAAKRQVTLNLLETLTPRELEVLKHVAKGRLNKQIAFDLTISEVTVKLHRSNAMRKMGLRSVSDLIHAWQSLPEYFH